MVDYCIRQILMDWQTLADYENNRNACWKDIKRRLLLNERMTNPHIPDHYLRASIDWSLPEDTVRGLADMLTKGIYFLAAKYITKVDNKLYIKESHFFRWQELLTFCPPLLLIASYLYHENKNIGDVIDNIKTYIPIKIKYTALLSPYIKGFDILCETNKGFNDLHIHLNGSTETDIIWQDALNQPNKLRKSYKTAFGNDLVIEQNEQEHIFKDSNELFNLLERARALRYYLIQSFKCSKLTYPNTDARIQNYTKNLIRDEHPLQKKNRLFDLEQLEWECLMYVKIFQILENGNEEQISVIAKAFHHYLLILGTINRFVVQQIHQKGFQQFQKITQNDFRSFSERNYEKRFFQLCGNNPSYSNFRVLEGRFAPKMNPREIDSLIAKIRIGWYAFKYPGSFTELRLITHFIKRKSSFDECFRHEKLRNNLWIQANAILSLIKDEEWMKYPESDIGESFYKFTGIDAAASEFDAPPEVFAPIFRLLRNNGIKNFTFHVGEDFFHIVSGLRAIYEAIYFLEFTSGNRIGHATALGISPQLWKKRIGGRIFISKGEWLDNLIFVYDILRSSSYYQSSLKKKIEKEINRLAPDIFKGDYQIESLIKAWRFRKWDPALVLNGSYKEAQSYKNFDEQEWKKIQGLDIKQEIKIILREYHDPLFRKKYDAMTLVDFSLIDVRVIKILQSKIISVLKKKNIIVETLPSSNTRISIYKSHGEHHIKDWMRPCVIREGLKIVVGSDDAGIFATNIYNEYANIYCNLISDNKFSHNEAMEVIEQLNKNGGIYKFSSL